MKTDAIIDKDPKDLLLTKTFSLLAIFHMIMSLGIVFHQLLVKKLIENEQDSNNMSVTQYFFNFNDQVLNIILMIPGNLMCGMYLYQVNKEHILYLTTPKDSDLIANSSKSERKSLK